ncbi:MAG: hypothetical protein ACE5GX_15170 [Thermoanaerobaculia bacterium]
MIVMNWNIEHMNSWWEGGSADPPTMRTTFGGNSFSPAITDVQGLATRVGNVINAVGPDVVTIQEGAGMPEMVDFFDRFVDGDDWSIQRGSGGGQALVVAARVGAGNTVTALGPGPEVVGEIDLGEPYVADVDADLEVNPVNFARMPQVINLTAHGEAMTLINNHLKSKFVRDGESRFNAGGETRLRFFADALVARRRISGEAFRIRSFLDALFGQAPNALVVVTGDLNDGAGADFFEENFLTHSVVDRVFGSIFRPATQLRHVLFHGGSTDFTAQFFDFITGELRDLVLDHIGLSPAIDQGWTWAGRVAVAEFEAQVIDDSSLNDRDQAPSDHRPVVVEMTPNP